MLDARQSRLFNKAYDTYRGLLRFISENMDMVDQAADKFPATVMLSDLELQRILLDIASCEKYVPEKSEQEFITSIIESEKLLKCSVPGYFLFFRDMSVEKYEAVKAAMDEMTQDIPVSLNVAVNLKQRIGKDFVSEIIDMYLEIFDDFMALSDARDDEKKSKADKWTDIFREYALEHGAEYKSTREKEQIRVSKCLDKDSIEGYLKELSEMVGLDVVKNDVNEIVNILRVNELRKARGIKPLNVNKHLVFMGNPGTGKTTVARILAGIYKQLGVLSKGQIVEVDRSGLVAGYIGQTETKTQAAIEEAMGGILFIDEAYELANKGANDFGSIAIAIILKAMEDYREDFTVIVAGYPEEMESFIESNPGLRSRFTKYIDFPDYSAQELLQIFKIMMEKDHYELTEEAEGKLLVLLTEAQNDVEFGNARGVRNTLEVIEAKHSTRFWAISGRTPEELTLIRKEDIPDKLDRKTPSRKVGFLKEE